VELLGPRAAQAEEAGAEDDEESVSEDGSEDWVQGDAEDDEGTLAAEEALAAVGGAQVCSSTDAFTVSPL
jgi:hypothetical protein